MGVSTWTRIAAIAGTQHGVISVAQLYRCGVSRSGIRRAVRAGHLHRLHQGVYAVGHRALTHRSRWKAATMAGGSSAFLSHGPAAELERMLREKGRPVELTIASNTGRSRRGLRIHRVATLQLDETTCIDGIPCTTPARTIVDLAAAGNRRELGWAVKEGEGKIFQRDDVELILARHPSCPGTPLLVEMLALRDPAAGLTDSELEDIFVALCRRYGIPLPEIAVTLHANGARHRADFVWPQLRLVVETDGRRWHSGKFATSLDEIRDRDLTIAGYRVQRLTWRQILLDPDGAAATVLALVAQQQAVAA